MEVAGCEFLLWCLTAGTCSCPCVTVHEAFSLANIDHKDHNAKHKNEHKEISPNEFIVLCSFYFVIQIERRGPFLSVSRDGMDSNDYALPRCRSWWARTPLAQLLLQSQAGNRMRLHKAC